MIPLSKNPKHVKNFSIEGYKDIGWKNGWDYELVERPSRPGLQMAVFKESYYLLHTQYGRNHVEREHDNSIYVMRGTDVITICDECKIFWHVDMSD